VITAWIEKCIRRRRGRRQPSRRSFRRERRTFQRSTTSWRAPRGDCGRAGIARCPPHAPSRALEGRSHGA
jgi:hypothetical protein